MLTGVVLDDCNFGALCKLASRVAETVLSNENGQLIIDQH